MIFSLKMVVSPFQGKLLMEEIHTSHSTNWLACLEISGPREWKEDGLNTKVTFCLFTVEDYIVDGLSIEIWTQFGFSHYSQWPHSYENYIESQLGWFMKTNQDRLDFGYFPDRQKHRSLRYWLLPSQNNLRGGECVFVAPASSSDWDRWIQSGWGRRPSRDPGTASKQ